MPAQKRQAAAPNGGSLDVAGEFSNQPGLVTNPKDGLGAVGGYDVKGVFASGDNASDGTVRGGALSNLSGHLNVKPERPSVDNLPGRVQEFRDKFENVETNPIKQVVSDPVSTFSIDVDTASYSFVRRALNAGRLPPKNAVRVEELINYFSYGYETPENADVPFKVQVNVVPPPWNDVNKLVHVSVKGYDLKTAERPRANLVFPC